MNVYQLKSMVGKMTKRREILELPPNDYLNLQFLQF